MNNLPSSQYKKLTIFKIPNISNYTPICIVRVRKLGGRLLTYIEHNITVTELNIPTNINQHRSRFFLTNARTYFCSSIEMNYVSRLRTYQYYYLLIISTVHDLMNVFSQKIFHLLCSCSKRGIGPHDVYNIH